MKKPVFDIQRAVSWSMLSAWEYDPEDWYRRYVLGIKSTSAAMEFGNYVDKRLQEDPKYLPHVPRYHIMQHKMEAKLGKINLVGVADGYDPMPPPDLADYKTGMKIWDQKRADEHGQFDFYLLLLWLTEQIRPEEVNIFVHWLPTRESGGFKIELVSEKEDGLLTFPTSRNMQQILAFGGRIQKAHKAMQAYAKAHA